jgi:mono/diheme cytochrome c family protein
MKKTLLTSAALLSLATSCKPDPPNPTPNPASSRNDPQVDTFSTPPDSPKVPASWAEAQKQRTQAKQDYVAKHQAAYDWFTNFAFSEEDGVPFILLRLLPVIAPEHWGSKDNFLDVIGLFNDPRQPGYPLPRGVGFSGLSRKDPSGGIDYTSFTCGACHIGRVALDNGTMDHLDGAINTQFNIASYRVRVYKTLEKIYAGATSKIKKDELAMKAFIEALDTMHLQDKNFFYRNYTYGDRHFDAAYEAQQVKRFKEKSLLVVPLFLIRAELEYEAYKALVAKNYQGFDQQMLAGMGGMVDATGVNTANIYILEKLNPLSHSNPTVTLPPTPGLTDIMPVWEQGKRRSQWNKEKTALIDGGGQWNGNVPIPMFRNLIAQLTFALVGTDVRVSAFGEELLDGLPANPYPFDVNVALAERGRDLFQANCAGCHRPHNGTVYIDMGTDLNRAQVVDAPTAESARKLLTTICSTKTTVDLGKGPVQPCAEYQGVSLAGKENIAMSPVDQHLGYNALPLGGIWAQAPYLHTGSIPTLYHLLVVSERPDKFIKGRLDYDKEKVGYAWELKGAPPGPNDLSYVYDTTAFKVLTKKGHDKDITRDGKTYKLDWSNDVDGAKAIVEYMKTL